jgi:hypothetical protein
MSLNRLPKPSLPVVPLLAVGLAAALCLSFPAKVEARKNPPIDLKQLGLSESDACGHRTVTFRVRKKLEQHTVFDVPLTKFQYRHCLAYLLDAARDQPKDAPIQKFIQAQLLHDLANERVRFYKQGSDKKVPLKKVLDDEENFDLSSVDRIIFVNDEGRPHNSLLQVKLGAILLRAASEAFTRADPDPELAETYVRLGLMAYDPVLDLVDDGGLRSRATCDLKPEDQCSWFHGVTTRSRPDAPLSGATLNKDIIVTNRLFGAADAMSELDSHTNVDLAPRIDNFRKAAIEGFNQLAFSSGNRTPGASPNLIDYIATDNGAPVKESWLYYSINPVTQGKYFLRKSNEYRNCEYQMTDIKMLYGVISNHGSYLDLSGLTEANSYLGESILDFIVETYRMKQADGGLATDSKTRGDGNFTGCKKGTDGLPDSMLDYLVNFGPEWQPPPSVPSDPEE